MAQRISDRILCIGRSHCVEKFGRPEKIFTSGYIRRLFGMTAGNFDEGSGMMELEGPKGRPEVFVIAGNGTGRHVFRKLQRSGIPFVTGILYRNDIDYPTAEALAVQVIASEAFEEVPEEQIREARQWMDRCDRVICCRENFWNVGPGQCSAPDLCQRKRQTVKGLKIRFSVLFFMRPTGFLATWRRRRIIG